MKAPEKSKITPSFSIKVTRRLEPVRVLSRLTTPTAIWAAVGARAPGVKVTASTPFARRLSYQASTWSDSTVLRMTALMSRPLSPIAVKVSVRVGR